MQLDYVDGNPRVYTARGYCTFYINGSRFVVKPTDLDDPERIRRSVDRAKASRPRRGNIAIPSLIIVNENVANRIGAILSHIVPRRFAFCIALILTLTAVIASVSIRLISAPPASNPMVIFAAVIALCVWHELGHAAAARRAGIRVDAIGAGIFLIFPVLLTRVSMVAILGHQERIATFSAGVLFQGYASILLIIFWFVHPESIIANILVVNTIIAITNLLPVLRFDGYHIGAEFIAMAKNTHHERRFNISYIWFNRICQIGLLLLFIWSITKAIKTFYEKGFTPSVLFVSVVTGIFLWRVINLPSRIRNLLAKKRTV